MTTESDRELLELAAKAGGIPIVPCTCSDTRWPFKHDEATSGKHGHWNPLVDDGDALRLAVKLGIEVASFSASNVSRSRVLSQMDADIREPHEGDPYAATRRAIVRAAAEIARATHKEGA